MRHALLTLLLIGCGPTVVRAPAHSSTIALSEDGRRIYVVNPDSDSVSILDADAHSLIQEVRLDKPVEPSSDGSYYPGVMPRSIAVAPDGRTLYVTGQRSGRVYAIEVKTFAVRRSAPIGSEPFGLLISPDGRDLYVACAQDAWLAKVDAASLTLEGKVAVAAQPWALGWSVDGKTLLVTHFLGAQLTAIERGITPG